MNPYSGKDRADEIAGAQFLNAWHRLSAGASQEPDSNTQIVDESVEISAEIGLTSSD
ncbi:hypothetical protein HALA3H3_290013 [Halomonas sp. A3H3]|mgnify:FL=1|nr:hypothetical protein HALA3H3_290013 [Halomonas sp. A3H3]